METEVEPFYHLQRRNPVKKHANCGSEPLDMSSFMTTHLLFVLCSCRNVFPCESMERRQGINEEPGSH
jgi:hypothetical protein